MKIIVDACSVIFIAHGDVCDSVLRLPDCEFVLGEVVVGACAQLLPAIMTRVESGKIALVANNIPAARFAQAVADFGLGPGETECILLASQHKMIVCTDDRKARRTAEEVLGASSVLGGLALLQRCVEAGLLKGNEARSAYELMRSRGAFLPDLPEDYFH